MLKSKIKFSYKDYKSLPESETKRYELLEGELIMVPSPSERHQSISRNLEFILYQFIRDNNLGTLYYAPFDVILGEDVVQPDIIYISKERLSIIAEGEIRGAPDLVIEILSPATAERDRTYKRTLYARHGVREYWLVAPDERSIEVMKLGEAGFEPVHSYRKEEILTSPLLEGLHLNLEEVF